MELLTDDIMELTSAIYGASASVTIQHHVIEHREMNYLVTSLRNLRAIIAPHRQDAILSRFISILSRYVFCVTSTPIPSAHPAIIDDFVLEEARVIQQQIAVSYSEYAEESKLALDACKNMYCLNINPLIQFLNYRKLFPVEHRAAMLVRDRRFVDLTREVIRSIDWLASADVKTPGELGRSYCLDDLVVIGPLHRFPSHVITAPRARSIHVVRYACIRDAWKHTHAFTAPIISRHQPVVSAVINRSETLDDWLPEADAVEMVQQLAKTRPNTDTSDITDARAALLAGGHLVFLESSPSATMLVIDLDREQAPITRLATADIHPGMFLLLRTDGSGDYVVAVADQLLGQRAGPLRQKQRHWKDLLREEVNRRDLLTIAVRLLDLGSVCADEQNVRNWMSHRTIGTHAREDFDAVMNLVGLQLEAEDYWQSMSEIRRAHQKAGSRIRRLLLERVRDTDLETLEEAGIMEFHLGDAGGGTLTAFRIEKVLAETLQVPPHRIGHPIAMLGSSPRVQLTAHPLNGGSGRTSSTSIPEQLLLNFEIEPEQPQRRPSS